MITENPKVWSFFSILFFLLTVYMFVVRLSGGEFTYLNIALSFNLSIALFYISQLITKLQNTKLDMEFISYLDKPRGKYENE